MLFYLPHSIGHRRANIKCKESQSPAILTQAGGRRAGVRMARAGLQRQWTGAKSGRNSRQSGQRQQNL